MKFSIALIFMVSLFMLGCGSTSSQETESSTASSKFLTIKKSPSLGVPVSINQKFSIIFSSDIDPTTVNSSTVYIEEVPYSYNSGTAPSLGTTSSNYYLKGASLDVESNRVTVTPYKYFSPNVEYKIVVTTGLKDINGKSLAQNYVYQFMTQYNYVNPPTLSLGSIKPSGDDIALVSTDIVMDFNNNISSEAEYSATSYFSVTDTNGTEIAGRTEVFNRLLKFIPNNPLPYGTQINVTLNDTIYDIYGHYSYYSSTPWHFQTKDLNSSPKSYLGFKSLNSISLGKTAYLVRTIKNTNTESTIAVARDGGIDIYKVKYPSPQSKPTFEYLSSYALSSQVNAMSGFSNRYLLVGTMSQGVKVLDTSSNPMTTVGEYNTTATIYGVKIGLNSSSIADKAYAVGPAFGLQVYDVNSTSGALSASVSQSSSALGEALDVAAASVYESGAGANVRKIYVADYTGHLIILDENATQLSSVNMDSSTKKIIVQKDYNGINSYLSLLSSSGINKQMNFDGSVQGGLVDLTKSANDMLGHIVSSTSYIYYAVGSDGITISDGDSIQQLISTGGNAVSLDFVKGYQSGISFLVTLNSDGLLQLFNAKFDDVNPSLSYNTPQDGDTTAPIDTTIEFYFSDDYLDEATITANSFSIRDNNTSSEVSFSMSKNTSGAFVLTPTNHLVADHNYSVTVSSTISDMIGNKFNNGVEKIINFKTAL